jgi:hypothetical protein
MYVYVVKSVAQVSAAVSKLKLCSLTHLLLHLKQ